MFNTPQTITLGGTQLELTDTTGVTVSGGGLSRVFQVDANVTASISGLTITGGSTTANGGGLYNLGTTTVTDCTVSGDSATSGGGVATAPDGTTTLINTTITSNSATNGGGAYTGSCGTTAIINCTISGNTAAAGGGLYNAASANLSACTIAGNSAAVGGGIDNEPTGVATLEDTIVAANNATGGSPSDIGGNNPSGVVGTYDLVGTGGAGGLAGGTGNIVLTNLDGLGLAPLGNYGGPTQTIPSLPGSAAIDTGISITGLSTDQPGVPVAASPDIGAYQSRGLTLSVVAGSTPQAVATGAAFTDPLAVTVTAINPIEPVEGGVVSFSANPARNGPSANLSAATAIIGASGIAQVTATANSIAGPYTVTATEVAAASPATFTLTNLVALTFSGIVSQSIAVGTARATFSGTLALGVQTPQGEMVAVTLDGVTQQAAIDSAGAFSATFATAGLAVSPTPYTVSYVYTSDGTFADASTTSALTVNVNRSTPAITWARPADIPYGTALSAAQLDATASVPGTFTYNPPTGAVLSVGIGQTLWVTFTPTDTTDYNTAAQSVTISVDKATPIITWANPADIPYGTALSTTQLDAASSWIVAGVQGSVSGTFTYTPAAGTVPSAGPGQTLSVTFAPSDSTDYNPASATASLTVLPTADLAITQFTAAPSTVQIGDDLTYTILVVNNGPYPATSVTVTSSLGTGASYIAGSGTFGSSGTVNLQGTNVVGSLNTLAVNASATLTFTVIPTMIATLTGSASVTSNVLDTNTSNNSASVSSTVVDRVGTIEFSTAGYSVPDNAGSAMITVNRVNGARGTVTVDYKTVPINAIPGLDYTPVSGTLTFPTGVTSETIVVPVLDNPYNNQNHLVSLVLSNVQTTATLGQPILGSVSTATLTIQDIDPDFSPLVVNSVKWVGTAQRITHILVTFNKPLITATAVDPANYALVNVGPDGKYGTLDDLGVAMSVAMYQSSNFVVALTPAQPLPANRFFHLWINSGTSGGIEDVGNNMLAGNGSTAGTSFTAMLAQGASLKYDTPAGDQVTLKITGGGYLDDLLSGSGQGIQLTVVGEVPHHTVLSGSVRKARGGSGWAYLGDTIWGLGNFGDVRVKLASPPFQISQYPFSPGSAASKDAVASSKQAVKQKRANREKPTIESKTMNRPFHAFHRGTQKA